MALPLIIFSGESNSGGFAPNSSATAAEKLVRPEIRILNNNSFAFQPLQLGINNLIGHISGNAEINAQTVHGWELGLANEASRFSEQVYLCKTGHGGSTISQWSTGNTSTYYAKFLERINAIKSMPGGMSLYQPILWYTQGINDALASTSVAAWKSDTIAHFAKIRLEIPGIPILMTDLTPSYPSYSAAILEVISVVPKCYFIPTTGASLRDTNHWDYLGMKLLANRLVTETLRVFAAARGNGIAQSQSKFKSFSIKGKTTFSAYYPRISRF